MTLIESSKITHYIGHAHTLEDVRANNTPGADGVNYLPLHMLQINTDKYCLHFTCKVFSVESADCHSADAHCVHYWGPQCQRRPEENKVTNKVSKKAAEKVTKKVTKKVRKKVTDWGASPLSGVKDRAPVGCVQEPLKGVSEGGDDGHTVDTQWKATVIQVNITYKV